MGYLGYFKMYTEKEMYLGGLMVVDHRGIPVEFKYTDTIKPSKLQKVLYGGVLEKYLKEEVIIGNLIEKLEIRPEVYVVDKLENMVLNKFVKEQVMLLKETPNKSLDNPGDYQFLKDDEAVYQVDESNQPIRIQFKEGKGEELFNMLNSFGLEGNLIEPFKRVEEALRLICKGDL